LDTPNGGQRQEPEHNVAEPDQNEPSKPIDGLPGSNSVLPSSSQTKQPALPTPPAQNPANADPPISPEPEAEDPVDKQSSPPNANPSPLPANTNHVSPEVPEASEEVEVDKNTDDQWSASSYMMAIGGTAIFVILVYVGYRARNAEDPVLESNTGSKISHPDDVEESIPLRSLTGGGSGMPVGSNTFRTPALLDDNTIGGGNGADSMDWDDDWGDEDDEFAEAKPMIKNAEEKKVGMKLGSPKLVPDPTIVSYTGARITPHPVSPPSESSAILPNSSHQPTSAIQTNQPKPGYGSDSDSDSGFVGHPMGKIGTGLTGNGSLSLGFTKPLSADDEYGIGAGAIGSSRVGSGFRSIGSSSRPSAAAPSCSVVQETSLADLEANAEASAAMANGEAGKAWEGDDELDLDGDLDIDEAPAANPIAAGTNPPGKVPTATAPVLTDDDDGWGDDDDW